MIRPEQRLTFLVKSDADAAVLGPLGAHVVLVENGFGQFAERDVVLIARGHARDLLMGMNLGATGRYIDLGRDGSVAGLLQEYPGADPIAVLDELARDIFWHEERPIGSWEVEEQQPGVSSGFGFLDPYLRWTCPEVVVLAGPYGCGKSSFARLLAYRWADTVGRQLDAYASIVGWEDKVSTVKTEVLRYSLEGDVKTLNTAQAKRLADMENRIRWTQRHPDDARLIEWYCQLVEHRAKYHGVKFYIFDPFNEHDEVRGRNQSETEYVREVMTRFRKLAHSLDIIIVIVAHVSAKSYDETGAIKPFRVANAHGSVQFGNKADRGICIVRATLNASDIMVLHFDKCKNEETMGCRGTIACVFNPKAMTLAFDAGATAEVRKLWA